MTLRFLKILQIDLEYDLEIPFLKSTKNTNSKIFTHSYVHFSPIYSGQKMENKVLNNGTLDDEDIMYILYTQLKTIQL